MALAHRMLAAIRPGTDRVSRQQCGRRIDQVGRRALAGRRGGQLRILHSEPAVNMHSRKSLQYPASQTGLSLIELMVALTIGLLLAIGIIQIFNASKISYQWQEGLSRIQENGRFVSQYLQNKLRMAGYMGCGNDVARAENGGFINHLAYFGADPPDPELRFQRPIEGLSF